MRSQMSLGARVPNIGDWNAETPRWYQDSEFQQPSDSITLSSTYSMSDLEMAAVFARKAALRKSMLKTLRGISESSLESQCEVDRGCADSSCGGGSCSERAAVLPAG